MRFVEFVDYGDAPEFFVGTIARVSQINDSMVRLTFVSPMETEEDGIEYRVVHHQIWSLDDWLRASTAFRQAREIMSRRPEPAVVVARAN